MTRADDELAYQQSADFDSHVIEWARGDEGTWMALVDTYLESDTYTRNLADFEYGEALA